MKSGRLRGGLSAAIAVGAFAILAPAAVAADDSGDVEAVYCLNDARRPEVVRAAVALGTGRPVRDHPEMLTGMGSAGRALTLEEWRRQRPEDFARVCSALMKANSVATGGGGGTGLGGGWTGLLTSLLLLVAGSALTTLGKRMERADQHQREQSEALTAAINHFRAGARDYLKKWALDVHTPHDQIAAERGKLVDVLRGLDATGSRAAEAARLRAEIPLARPLTAVDDSGRPKRSAQREKESDALRETLDAALARAEVLALGSAAWRRRRARHYLGMPLRAAGRRVARIGRGGRQRAEPPGGGGR
jgi:hypothetical protein